MSEEERENILPEVAKASGRVYRYSYQANGTTGGGRVSMINGTWEGESGTYRTLSEKVEGGYTLSIFSPEGALVIAHGAQAPISLLEITGSNSLVSSILRRDLGL